MENFDSLRQAVHGGKVDAATFKLPLSLLGSGDITGLAEKYLEEKSLTLNNYRIEESDAEQSITVRGTGGNLPFTGMEVTAIFQLQGNSPALNITATVTEGWNFSAPFPLLKNSLLAGLRFSPDSVFRLASYDISNDVPKQTLFFDGTATLDSVLTGLRILFGNLGPRISGTIDIVEGAPQMTLSTGESAPVDIGFSVPLTFAFDACSQAITAEENEKEELNTVLPDARVFFRFRTTIHFTAQGKSYRIPMAAIVYDPAHQVVLSIDLESFTDFISAGIAELTALTNQIPFAEGLAGIQGFQLAELVTLKNLSFYLDPAGSSKLTSIALSIESKKAWTIVRYDAPSGTPVVITLDTVSLLISIPMATRTPEFTLTGVVGIGADSKVVLSLFTPDLTVVGNLAPGTKLSLKQTIGYFTGADLAPLPDVTVSGFALAVQPLTAEFSLDGVIAGDWSIPLGILSSFALKELSFSLSRTSGEGFAGRIGSKAAIGSATFDASYAFPGNNIVIGGKIPSIHLKELISTLSNNGLVFPDALDFTLTDSQIAITKQGNDYVLFLRTGVPDVGTLFFQIQRTDATGWGAAVGVDLSVVKRIGDLPGFGFMNAIDLTFERMILVLSSVDLPSGYTFPDLATYSSTAPAATGKVTIPSGIGTPKRGINFYAQFAFGDRAAARNEALLKLYDFFSLQRVLLDVAVQVSWKDSKLSALMMAGVAVSGEGGISGISARYNMEMAAYLAVEFASDGNAAIFLRGLLTLSAPASTTGEKLSFAMELGLQPNGFYIAGAMKGVWTNPFGIQGISVSNTGLMVGMNWEGIPSVGFAGTLTVTSFQGSLACILNSENPVNSVLAGSLSNLTLGDIVKTFVGLVVEPDPTAKEIISVLNNVSVEGINTFTLPGNLADAFDKKDLKAIAPAFSQGAGVTLTPTPEATMLIPGVPGESWFLTDKTNGVTHYEIKRRGDNLVVWQQAQLYFSPNSTRIATLDFPEGYQIYGQLNVFGFRQRTDVTISISKGIGAEVRMSRINLFGGLLRVERAPGDTRDDGRGGTTPDGPYLSISTYARPPYNTPHFYISGALSFLGLMDQVMDIAVNEKGVHVLVQRRMFGTDFNFAFDFKASPLSLSGSGTAGVKLNPKIDLSRFGLGTYNILDVDFGANLSFGASGEKLLARAGGNFYFSIPEFNIKLGPYALDIDLINVDQPLAKLQNLLETAIQGIGSLAQDLADKLLSNAKNFAELVKKGVITLTDSLDSVLKRIFNISLADLYATTQCFAETRLAPRMMRPLAPMPNYTPAPGESFPGAAAPQDDPLAQLRALRDDLGDSPTGQWVLNIYNTLSEPLVHLYDYKPANPDDPTFDQVLTAYNGYQIYNDLLRLLRTAGTSQPFNVTQEFLNDGLSLVSAIIDLADLYSQSGDPQREREGKLIVKGISGLLNQVSLLEQFRGLNYSQIREKIKTMQPPPSPFA